MREALGEAFVLLLLVAFSGLVLIVGYVADGAPGCGPLLAGMGGGC